MNRPTLVAPRRLESNDFLRRFIRRTRSTVILSLLDVEGSTVCLSSLMTDADADGATIILPALEGLAGESVVEEIGEVEIVEKTGRGGVGGGRSQVAGSLSCISLDGCKGESIKD